MKKHTSMDMKLGAYHSMNKRYELQKFIALLLTPRVEIMGFK